MGGADHRPFASDLVETSEQELSKASGAFDLTENGFDDLLAQSVAGASPGAFELEGHSGGREARTRILAPSRQQPGGEGFGVEVQHGVSVLACRKPRPSSAHTSRYPRESGDTVFQRLRT